MADDDDLAERLSFRVSTKERARIQDEADREQIRVAQVARRYFRRGFRSDDRRDDGGGIAA
jgi:hypothetical protein